LTHETRYSYPPTPPDIMFTVNPFALVDKSDPTAKIPIDKLPTPLVKLTDFGLARFIDPTSPMLQTRCGSESFTAPEIIMGNPYDGRDTDSWAVGVILFALVTGELPFDRVTSATAHDEEAQRRKRIMAIAKGDYKWPIGC
jgi:tRNA (cytidine32/guanosine34-2'-O)-methyltransferase